MADWTRTAAPSDGSRRTAEGSGPFPTGYYQVEPERRTAEDWYGGRNLGGTESGWDSDFFRRAMTQRDEQFARAGESGNPGDFYNWFQRDDATGVATWSDPNTMITAENGQRRALRVGDTFDNGEWTGNVYTGRGKYEADVLLGEFVFDGAQKARLFQNDQGLTQEQRDAGQGSFSRELQMQIEQNSKQAEFGQQSYETQRKVEEQAEYLADQWWSPFYAFGTGAAGGTVAGSVFGIPGMVGGFVIGGVTGLLNQDQLIEGVARAQVKAAETNDRGLKASAYAMGMGEALTFAISPFQNAAAGSYDLLHGEVGDSVASFHEVDPATGERKAGGLWQAAHLGTAVADSFLQFGSAAALRTYQASLGFHVAGKSIGLAEGAVWSDAEGGWHDFEDWGERSAAVASVGIDVLQLGVSQWAVTAAAHAKAVGTGTAVARGAVRDPIGRGVDAVWGRLPSLSRVGREQKELFRSGAVARTEQLSGQRFFLDEAGNVVAVRPTAVALVPSELTRYLPSQMTARYAAIKRGDSPGSITAEDMYEAALRFSGNGGRMSDAMLLAFAEGSEEMAQYFLDVQSYSGRFDAKEMWTSGAYGAAAGLGMGISPMLSRASSQQQMKANGRLLEMARTGNESLSSAEWDERWDAMSEAERRRASTGTTAQQEEARAIAATIAARHIDEMQAAGMLPMVVAQDAAMSLSEEAAAKQNNLSDGAQQAKLLPNELFSTQKMHGAKGPLFEHSAWLPHASATTSQSLALKYATLVKALRAEHKVLADAGQEISQQLQDELAAAEHLAAFMKSRSEQLAQMDPEKRRDEIKLINFILKQAAVDGVLKSRGEDRGLDRDMVRRAAQIAYGRHPEIDAGSVFQTVPQIHPGYEARNMHGSVGVGINMAKVAQLDFDGDTMVDLFQVILPESGRQQLERGTQYLAPVEESVTGGGTRRTWKVGVDRPKDEPRLIRQIAEQRMHKGPLRKDDLRDTAIEKTLKKMRRGMRKEFEYMLPGTRDMPNPFLTYWHRFERELLEGDPDAVTHFIQSFVDHEDGAGGVALVSEGQGKHIPLVLRMSQMFSTGLDNIDRNLRWMDPALMKKVMDPTNRDPIPEQNRAYIQAVARKNASTDYQTMQMLYNFSGERAAQHAAIQPWMQMAIDLTFADPGDSMTEQEIALVRDFYLQSGPGRAESTAEAATTRDQTVRRVRQQMARLADAANKHLAGSARTTDLTPDGGLMFLMAGMRTADVGETGDGERFAIPRDGRDGKRRSDISLAQLLLRHSVQQDKNKHRTTRADDPIHAKLTRLGNMSRREGPRSKSLFLTLQEVFGEVPIGELLPPEQAARFGEATTMNELLQQFMVMSKPSVDAEFEKLMAPGVENGYIHGKRGDAPWTKGEIIDGKLNAYTLMVDTLRALSNHQDGLLAVRAEGIRGEMRNGLAALQQFLTALQDKHADRINAYLGRAKGTPVTRDDALQYALSSQEYAQEVMHFFPEKARAATFRITEDGRLGSKRWVTEALTETSIDRAELMLMVESAIDHLNATGARIRRDPETGEVLVSRPTTQSDQIESRLAILINDLARKPSSRELLQFFEMYEQALNGEGVPEFYRMLNKETGWIGEKPSLVPYFDSIKDYETDLADLWSAGTMNTARFDKITENSGLGRRLQTMTDQALQMFDQTTKNKATLAQLREAHAAAQAGGKIAGQAQALYEKLVRAVEESQRVAVMHGGKLIDQTMGASAILLDLADKGAAPEVMEQLGNAYVLTTTMDLQPGLMQEMEQATAHTVSSVMNNPGLLTRGPVYIQDGDGRVARIDLTTMDGVMEALELEGMETLIYSAIFRTEMDIDANGILQHYSRQGPGATLEEYLNGVMPNLADVNGNLTLDQAVYVIQTIDGHARRAGMDNGTEAEIKKAFLPIQTLLNNLMIAYSSRPDWHTLSESQQAQERQRAIIKVGTLLFRMSKLRSPEAKQELLKMFEAGFVGRYQEMQGLPSTVEQMIADIEGTTDESPDMVRMVVTRTAVEALNTRNDELVRMQQRRQTLREARRTAVRYMRTQEIEQIDRDLDAIGMTEEEVVEEQQQIQTQMQILIARQKGEGLPVNAGMVRFRAAFHRYQADITDKSAAANERRKALLELVVRTDAWKRLNVGKEGVATGLLDTARIAHKTQYAAAVAGDVMTQDEWVGLAVMAAKLSVAEASVGSGSSVLFAATPSMDESDGIYFWDESFSSLARPLANQYVLDALDWMGTQHRTGEDSAQEIANWAMNSGPFATRDFGTWNPLLASTMQNMVKAMEGASVTLAVPIGGSLPKTQFDAAVASYSDWDADILPEHFSTAVLRFDTSEENWHEYGNWTVEDEDAPGKPIHLMGKLHHHFARTFDDAQIMERLEETFSTEEGLVRYFQGPRYGNDAAAAARLAQEYMAKPHLLEALKQDTFDKYERWFRQAMHKPPAAPDGYFVMDMRALQRLLLEFEREIGFGTLELKLEYVDIEKKPWTGEYRNHGLFDGVGRRSELEDNISPFGALMFGTDGLSKILQQAVFDYAARGGTAYRPYAPSKHETYRDKREQAATPMELFAGIAEQIMSRDYEKGPLLIDDWPAVLKLVMGRHVFRGKDPEGVERLMWGEEVVGLYRQNPEWDWNALDLIPLSEEVFRLLHDASSKQAGYVVTKPSWTIDEIDRNPDLSDERLERLGLSNLGRAAPINEMPFARMRPRPRVDRLSPQSTGRARSSLKQKAEEGLRQAQITDRFRSTQDAKTLQARRANRVELFADVRNKQLSASHQRAILSQIDMPIIDNELSAIQAAHDALRQLEQQYGPNSNLRGFLYQQDAQANWERGELNSASLTEESGRGDGVSWDDVAFIDLASILNSQEFRGDMDAAFVEAMRVLDWFSKRGTKIVLLAQAQPVFLNRVSEWLGTGATDYVKFGNSKYVWEPVTDVNQESATDQALESSLSAFSTFLPRNAHVAFHMDAGGVNIDENAGALLRPEQLAMPHTQKYQVLPTTLSSAKFGQKNGAFMFGLPAEGPQYRALVADALQFLTKAGGQQQLKDLAATSWDKKDQSMRVNTDRSGEAQADPQDISLYRMFEDTGIEHAGVRSFDDALSRLIDTLQSGRLPLYEGETDLMAGDFYVVRDRSGERMFFARLGFEVPSSTEMEMLFSDGATVAAAPPKIDKDLVIPPNFTIVKSDYDRRGRDFEIRARLDVWSKIIMQGDATKYTMVEYRDDYEIADVMVGQNGRDLTFATSSEAQLAKFGYSRPGTGFKAIFSIAGMDEMRIPLVNTLMQKQYTSTTDPAFEKDWSDLRAFLNAWANYDFGMTETEIKELINTNQLFDEGNIEANMILEKYGAEGMITELPNPEVMDSEQDIEQTITRIFLGVLAAPRIKLDHIAYTPGVWTIPNPDSTESAILDMPDLFTDTLSNGILYPKLRPYLIKKINSRLEKFPEGHEMEGRRVGFFDEDFRYHHMFKHKATGKWLYQSGWLSIDFPVAATQNAATYANRARLQQKSGFTPHVAQVMALALNARMARKRLDPGQVDALDLMFGDHTTEFTEQDATEALFSTTALNTDGVKYTPPEMQPMEIARNEQKRRAIRDYDVAIDKSDWGDTLLSIEQTMRQISSLTGLDNSGGGLERMFDMMARMFYGKPGPIAGQENWTESMSREDYLGFVQNALRQMKQNKDPMTGGAVPLMPPAFATSLKQAGKWAPATRDGFGKREVANDWDSWVKALFGQMVNSPFPLHHIHLEEFDGLLQLWKDSASTLDGLGLSLDNIAALLPKDRKANSVLEGIELLSQRGREDPLILEAWDEVAAGIRGERSDRDLATFIQKRDGVVEKQNSRRREWMAKQKMPKTANPKATVKDYMSEGHYLIQGKAQEHGFFSFLTNVSHMTRLGDPAIFASGYIEQPVRMTFEHLTDLLTGRYRGRGSKSARRVLQSKPVQGLLKSELVQDTLGFSDFQSSFTLEDQKIMEQLGRHLGDDSRWLAMLYEDSEYTNLVKEGSNWLTKGAEKGAGFVARTFSDPLYGTSQYAAAMRYLGGVVEHMHGMGIRVPMASLAVELTRDPRWLEKQYGNIGLNAHTAGMNRVKQIRSQKLTPASRAVKGSVDFLTSSPHRFFNLLGWGLNIPFAYTRFQMNGLQFISGMDGWSQASMMFFAGRRRPKWLGGGRENTENYWDLEDVLETIDLRRTFVRSGATLTTLFTMGMLAGGTFGFGGENEEERRRRRQAMYMGLIDYKDPREPENNFRNADAIFVDSIPILSNLFDDGAGANAIVPHWIFRQFTSPIIGFSRFFETMDPREIGYGFLDAFSAVPYSVKRLWDEADATAKMLVTEAEESAADPSAIGTARTLQLLVTAVGIYERALFENQFINTLYVGADKYDRDPWTVPDLLENGELKIGPDGQPVPTDSLVQYLDEETGLVENAYLTRGGTEGARYQYAENNAVFAHMMALFSGDGFSSDYLRQNMVTRKREIELEETPEAKAEAAIYGLFLQGGGLEALSVEEIEFALRDKYADADVYVDYDDVRAEAEAIHASGTPEGALSFMGPEGETLTDWGGDRIIDGILKGTIEIGSPEMIGVSMDRAMRERLTVTIKERLVQDGLDLGLPQRTAEYRADRFWYGEDDRPLVPGIRDILWDERIPYSNKVRYNQLNVMYTIGPDGKPWATPYERKTMMQAFLPLPHNQITPGSGLKNDGTGSLMDEILGINTGLAGLERIPNEPIDLKPDDDLWKAAGKDGDGTGGGRKYTPWSRYSGSGGGGFTPAMRALPNATAARFNTIPMLNIQNPYIRRARVNRQRIWSQKGRLKQWQ